MSWLQLAFANLRAAPLTTAVNAVLMALGVASIVLLLLIGDQLSQMLSRDARGIDLVLGAKGSPVQLVLSSVYHADVPTGNIAKAEAERWAGDARVARAVPLSLGDSYRGFRIVGTTEDYAAIYQASLRSGRYWQGTMEAVVGATVSRAASLPEGARFAGVHGMGEGGHRHSVRTYRVVGVLAETGTVLDRLILTSLDSVWALHGVHDDEEHEEHDEHEAPGPGREITAMLLSYASPLAAATLPRQINAESALQAAAPAIEVTRLLDRVGLGLDGLRAFSGLLLLVAGFSVFAALYGALKARRFDLAMLRCLGATRFEVLLSLLLEGLLLAALGVALGLVLGHGLMEWLGRWMAATRGVALTGGRWLPEEGLLLLGLLAIGPVSAALPAWQAYRADVARTLASA